MSPRSFLGLLLGGTFAAPGITALHAQDAGIAATIAVAVEPLPAALRAGAGVERLDRAARPHTLRPSRNGLVCLTYDRGEASVIFAECHHTSYLPVVYRMKQLAAAGVAESLADATIESEIRSGQLTLPAAPTLSYVTGGQLLHLPHATAESIGVVTEDDGIHTWLMAPGTYYAHLMISLSPGSNRPQ
jgi:hypothetical protein